MNRAREGGREGGREGHTGSITVEKGDHIADDGVVNLLELLNRLCVLEIEATGKPREGGGREEGREGGREEGQLR
jgi:hypothetical protein